LRENLSEVALVSDDEIIAAVRFLALRVRVIAEPTGAVGAAAVLSGKLARARGSAWCSPGGNVDPGLLIQILHGR